MARFFISYRRDSSSEYANQLCSSIEQRCGCGQAFLDTNPQPAIVPELLKPHLRREIVNCEMFIAVVDPKWVCDRLKETNDWIRFEIKEALEDGKTIVPLLVGGAAMPRATDLPDDIRGIVEWKGFFAPNEKAIVEFARKLCEEPPPPPPAGDLRLYLINLRAWLSLPDKPWDSDQNPYIDLNATRPDASLWSRLLGSKQSDVLAVLKREKAPVVIVGKPGSGKSVVLRRFAHSLIPEKPTNDTRPIPVWVDLKPYPAAERFEDYLWQWLESDSCPRFYTFIRGSLQRYMESGDVLWLLDGLDEGPRQEYERRLQKLQDFIKSYSVNRYVFACRYLDYKANFPVRRIVLRELDDRQVEEFIRKSK